jgi:hypothetical protein
VCDTTKEQSFMSYPRFDRGQHQLCCEVIVEPERETLKERGDAKHIQAETAAQFQIINLITHGT